MKQASQLQVARLGGGYIGTVYNYGTIIYAPNGANVYLPGGNVVVGHGGVGVFGR